MTISVTDQTLVDPSSHSTMEVVRESYKGKIDPDWCPGCGDFSVLAAIEKTLTEMGSVSYTHLTLPPIYSV